MNTPDKDREEAMEELAVGIVALCIHEGPVVEQMGDIKEMIRDYDSRIRSEAKAEALREAAERVERWCDDFDVPYFADIRAAIFADEPNKEE